jgi:lipopolysaccharide transport system permease protein
MIKTKDLSLRSSLLKLIEKRELLIMITIRELRARYRQSILGFGWALVQPVFQMLVISIIFGSFLRVPSSGIPYPIFSYAAILPWTLFSGSITAAIPSIIGNMNLVTKIYFPREIIPISTNLARLVDFSIALIVFATMMLLYKIPLRSTMLYVPLLLLIQIVLSLGISLIGSATSVFLRDISYAIPLGMQIWMYATPVIYPLDMVPPVWRSLYLLNPMSGIINAYRDVILLGISPNTAHIAYAAIFSICLLAVSYRYFKKLEMSMADVI